MSFGTNLRNELLYQDITVKELSAITSIPYTTLIYYMNTDMLPNVLNAVKIARALNVSVEFLLDGTGPEQNEKELAKARKIIDEISILIKQINNLFPKK